MAARPREDPPLQRTGLARIVLDNLEELLAVALLLFIGVAMAAQVFMRSAFSAPLSWPEELSQFFFVWASTLGAVGAAKRFGLVRVESLVEKFPATARRTLDVFIIVATAVLLGVLGWQGWQMAARSTYAAATLPITWAWMYSAAPVFAILLFGRLIQAQVFKYRFTFVETVVAEKRIGAELGGGAL
jgi:TRAP-type C4-dicarboxylate transport system permease small subunit